MRERDGETESDDGTFKNLYNNDLTTEGTARVILTVPLLPSLCFHARSLFLSPSICIAFALTLRLCRSRRRESSLSLFV